jgi:hypothetical protein
MVPSVGQAALSGGSEMSAEDAVFALDHFVLLFFSFFFGLAAGELLNQMRLFFYLFGFSLFAVLFHQQYIIPSKTLRNSTLTQVVSVCWVGII